MFQPLFVYGTLRPERAPAEIAAEVALLRPLGPATVRGRLLDLGAYPGLLLGGEELVHGELLDLPEDGRLCVSVWRALDEYEDFRPESPESSLFLRVHAEVRRSSGESLQAWVYVFNLANGRAANPA